MRRSIFVFSYWERIVAIFQCIQDDAHTCRLPWTVKWKQYVSMWRWNMLTIFVPHRDPTVIWRELHQACLMPRDQQTISKRTWRHCCVVYELRKLTSLCLRTPGTPCELVDFSLRHMTSQPGGKGSGKFTIFFRNMAFNIMLIMVLIFVSIGVSC